MSLRKVMEVLFPETSKIVESKIIRTQAADDSHGKKDNGAQNKNRKLFDKQAQSTPAIEPDFYDITFKLQA